MFAVIFIYGNLFLADRRETAKIRTRKISRHTVYQTFNETTFQNPQSTSIVLSCLFCIWLVIYILLKGLSAYTLFLNKNIFQAEIC